MVSFSPVVNFAANFLLKGWIFVDSGTGVKWGIAYLRSFALAIGSFVATNLLEFAIAGHFVPFLPVTLVSNAPLLIIPATVVAVSPLGVLILQLRSKKRIDNHSQ
jgi:hypothetical protein